MRPYGSKRSYDTEPRIKSARALVKREGEALVEEQLKSAGPEGQICDACGARPVDWVYMPGGADYCDTCVPRGCSCQTDEDGNDILGDDGRLQPCCEYIEVTL